jgi:ferredoxin
MMSRMAEETAARQKWPLGMSTEPVPTERTRLPAFAWDDWYATVGGRSIRIDAVDEYLRQIYEHQYPRFTGDVATERMPFASPEDAARFVKAKAVECGADIVGICEIEESDVYEGRTVTDRYAIAVGQRMRWQEFQVVPSRESAIECLRVYFTLGETVIRLAAALRAVGYACKVEHPIGDADLLHIPIGLKAGFGELGRHGSIIHPKLGPLFRMGSVTTSLDMTLDQPIDAGIARFCDTCRACRKYCPAHAIPDHRSALAGKDHLGHDRYVVDTGRCFPYFAKHNYCSICLPVCVYNHKEWAKDFDGRPTRIFPTVIMTEPPPPVDLPDPAKSHPYVRLQR